MHEVLEAQIKCDGHKPSRWPCSRSKLECAYDEIGRNFGPKHGYGKEPEAEKTILPLGKPIVEELVLRD